MARQSKILTPAANKVIEAVSAGHWPKWAAAIAGVAESSVRDWLSRGARAWDRHESLVDMPEVEAVYAEWYHRFLQAEAGLQSQGIAALLKAGEDPKNWRAIHEYMRARFPQQWDERQREDSRQLLEAAKRICDAETYGRLVAELSGTGTPAADRDGA